MNIMIGVWLIGGVAAYWFIPRMLKKMDTIEYEQDMIYTRQHKHTFEGHGIDE